MFYRWCISIYSSTCKILYNTSVLLYFHQINDKWKRGNFMILSFLGAAREVTGSCHYIEACGKKILIDCGLRQGSDDFDNQSLAFVSADIDYVILTHAHIDHSGRIPLMVKFGFRGKILSTGATADLCEIMLRDSAHIQEFEAEWKTRKGKRTGLEPVEPLYNVKDAVKAATMFESYNYDEIIDVCPGISIRFTDVGHLLGSASIEMWITENEISKKIVFSGDIGNLEQPILKDPQYISHADYVVMESTYGDRNHTGITDYKNNLVKIIEKTLDKGGNVILPSFAVGRTQELLYFLREIKEEGLVKNHPNFPVYIDSPLAIESTGIFGENTVGYYDHEAMGLIHDGVNPLSFPDLHMAITSDESKAINFKGGSKVIISASGMCEAGRIKHHLKHNLWRKDSAIVFVGYQAEGTLGRTILDGAKRVKIFGEEIEIKASIIKIHGMSGHADRLGLMNWISAFKQTPEKVFIVHGEENIAVNFASLLADTLDLDAYAPMEGAKFDLVKKVWLEQGQKRKRPDKAHIRSVGVFARLVASGQRLMSVINSNKGGANKDLAKFADQINSLCDKWER